MPSVEALRAALGARAAALEIEVVAETGSTNADLLERARTDVTSAARRPRLLVAARQTAGRGRRGRAWQAEPGASLTFSLAWAPARADLSGLSLAVGAAVSEALDPTHSAHRHIAIKWPNDLWLVSADDEGRKLGGILIETTPVDDGRVAVIGIGLNVLEQRVAGASSGVAWLRQIDADATPAAALERIVPALLDALTRFDENGFAPFAASFTARDLLRGRPVRCSGGDGSAAGIDGVAIGISPAGELLVRTAAGIEAIGSGEVSVRLADGRMAATTQRARAPC
jgi:BirA family biotin operon repressor/biotin-[acetyl-CoA-carboxylase] ligase